VPTRLPEPQVYVSSSGLACGPGLSDGTGHIALVDGAFHIPGRRWLVLNPDLTAAGSFFADGQVPLVPQASGWDEMQFTVSNELQRYLFNHRTIAPDGTPTSDVSIDPLDGYWNAGWSLAQDVWGGSLTTVVMQRSSPDAEAPLGLIWVQRFDTTGAPLWPAERTSVIELPDAQGLPFMPSSGVSSQGESLTLWPDGDAISLVWKDRNGNTLLQGSRTENVTDVFGSTLQLADPIPVTYGLRLPRLELVPLMDGSLAVRMNGVFVRVYERLAARTSPLPRWLADRAGWTYRFTRGARGYAALPPPSASTGTDADCKQAIDLVSASGRVCGRVTLHTASPGCGTGLVDQGWDGTVIQTPDPSSLYADPKRECRYVLWRELLR
jgi:hypothetical protein